MAAVVNDGMPHGTSAGNPCANKAISLVELEKQKSWIMVVEKMEKAVSLMEQTLSDKSKKYLELRREAANQMQYNNDPGRPGWVKYVQAKYSMWLYDKYGVEAVPSQQAMNHWMNTMIEITVRIAIHEGILW